MIDGMEIREARIKAGLSQTELADLLGSWQNEVSEWETGKRIPGRHTERILRLWIAGKLKAQPKRKDEV